MPSGRHSPVTPAMRMYCILTSLSTQRFARALAGLRADAQYVNAQVTQSNKEWARRRDSGFVAGTQQIGRTWRIIDEADPQQVTPSHRSLRIVPVRGRLRLV